MPTRTNALKLLILLLMGSGWMTAATPTTSPETAFFNESLRIRAGEGTTVAVNGFKKVVIDAGHGGKDPGGMGKNSQEKHIALSIARLLSIGIRTNYPDVEVIMTRADDTFIPLYERAEIANKAGADLFISIHANIMPGSSATYGTETFVMGQHVAEENLRVAKRENAAVRLEQGDVTVNYGYDPNSPEGHILMSMQQHAFLEQSILFADMVENQFRSAGRKSRGVKQAGFVVLKATTMPAVLVETGFMSCPDEEAYLLSSTGQQKLATALLNAFGEYYHYVTGTGPVAYDDRGLLAAAKAQQMQVQAKEATARPQVICALPAPADQGNRTVVQQDARAVTPRATEVTGRVRPPVMAKAVDELPSRWSAKGGAPPAPAPQMGTRVGTVAPRPYGTSPAQASVLSKEVGGTTVRRGQIDYTPTSTNVVPVAYSYPPTVADSTLPGGYRFKDAVVREAPIPAGQVDLRVIPDKEILFAVQVFATRRNLDLTASPWDAVPYPIVKVSEGGLNKYQVRNLLTARAAASARERIKAAGIRESLVVAYLNGQRLPPQAVNYLLAR